MRRELLGFVCVGKRIAHKRNIHSWYLYWNERSPSGRVRRYKNTGLKYHGTPTERIERSMYHKALIMADELSFKLRDPGYCDGKKIPEAVSEFVTQLDAKDQSVENTNRHVESFQAFLDTLGVKLTDQITQEHVDQWNEQIRGQVKASTANGMCCHINQMLVWFNTHGLVRELLRAKTVTLPTPRPMGLEDSEVASILGAYPEGSLDRAAMWLLTTGMRIGELCTLPSSAIDYENECLRVQMEDGETKLHERIIPMGAKLANVLSSTRGMTDLVLAGMDRKTVDGLIKITGVKGDPITPKRFRQWFRHTLEREMVPEYLIRALMGHRQPRVQASYAGAHNLRLSDLRPVMDKLEGHLP